MSGQGSMSYSNKEKYIGTFLKNNQHGNDAFFYANKEKFVGEWNNGEEVNGVLYSSTVNIKYTYKDRVKTE